MNNHPSGTHYIHTGVHKNHYWMVDCNKAWKIYNSIVENKNNK